MFLTEKELRDAFWKNYNYGGRALRYQFEIEFRTGSTDLLTLEKFQGHYQLNAFEFKLADMKKVILQAKGNRPYVNRSWVVVPSEKQGLLAGKYKSCLQEAGIGVITVEEGGRWQMVRKPGFQKDIRMNQEIIDFLAGRISG